MHRGRVTRRQALASCPLVPAAVQITGRGWPAAAYRRPPVSGVSSATQAVARWTAGRPSRGGQPVQRLRRGRPAAQQLPENRPQPHRGRPDQPAGPVGAGEDQRDHPAWQRQHVEPVTLRPRPPGGGLAAGRHAQPRQDRQRPREQRFRDECFRGPSFRGSGFRGSGFRGWGFRGWGFRGWGFRGPSFRGPGSRIRRQRFPAGVLWHACAPRASLLSFLAGGYPESGARITGPFPPPGMTTPSAGYIQAAGPGRGPRPRAD